MQVMIQVAVIGPREPVMRVIDAAGQFPELDLIARPYTYESEAMNLASQVDKQVEVILFTGPVPYRIATESGYRFTAKLMHINYVGTGLYRVFFQMFRDGILRNGCHLSVDLLHQTEVLETAEELELHNLQVSILNLGETVTSRDLYEFHSRHWQTGQADVAITCLYSVFERLRQAGVPVYCVLPTRESIAYALRSVLELGHIQKLRNSQVAACLVRAVSTAPDEVQTVHNTIGQVLGTTGLLVREDCYLYYTTRAMLSALTNGYSTALEFGSVTQRDFVMGVGIGQTPNASEAKSEEAFRQSNHELSGSVYILDDNNSVIRLNPANQLVSLEYRNRTYDDELRAMAQATNLSISTLSKMHFVLRTTGQCTVTAVELARHLDITLRSARRILKALLDAGYASVSGEEQPLTRGRPRNVYKVKFLGVSCS